ncbi:MAG: AAA family ATPase [Deltaproteobacteria bacterium]|nr:AAA family ATPase [Deltaproteobacteria bacterium]
MTITRITRLRGCGIFRDFSWPNDLPEFCRYNLIYGWNGTGKTTISRLLRDLERRKAPPIGQATVCIDGNDIRGEDFPSTMLSVRVFNRHFVEESVFPVGGGDVPPIFVFGPESAEKQKEAERLKKERVKADSELGAARSKNQEAERALDKYCQDRARVIKDTLRSPGQNPFNNYNKSDFRDRTSQMVTDDDAASHCLSNTDRETLLVQHKGTPKAKLTEITYQLPDLKQLANITSDLLGKTVVSAAIQSLKDDPELGEWTRSGLGLHKERQTDKCLFCEQPLPGGRLAALEAHFSTEYEKFMREIEEQVDSLQTILTEASELNLPNRAEFYDDMAAEYDAAERALRRAVGEVSSSVKSFIDALEKKKTKAFDALTLEVIVSTVDAELVERLNQIIRKHNQASDVFQDRVSSARDRLALDLIAADIDEFKSLQAAVKQTSADQKAAKDKCDDLAARITEIEKQIIEHRQPAEDLNNDLRQYLGHGELQVAVKDTGYSITRNGEPAEMLSEGEMTAIALLYFLKSLEDRDFDLPNGVVVLDDPVSSLDQNSMFGAFGYIRARSQAAAQVIILTHNFLFFRQILEWFGNLRGQDKRSWKVFMLECAFDAAGRSARIQAIDPLLKDFDSEYHYLFAQLHRMATKPQAASLEAYYHAPSIARRVIETFLAFRVPNMGGHNRLWGQMQTVRFDEEKKSRIYRFIQTHSHRDSIGNPDNDLTLLGESRAVLKDALDFMQVADADHVSRMIARITDSDGAD